MLQQTSATLKVIPYVKVVLNENTLVSLSLSLLLDLFLF